MADACKQNNVVSGTTKWGAFTWIAEPPLASVWELSVLTNVIMRTSHWKETAQCCDNVLLCIILLTYLLTYAMEQSPSWEANWFSASQEIPRILWNQPESSLPHSQMPALFIIFNNSQKVVRLLKYANRIKCNVWRILRILLSGVSHIFFVICTYFLSRYPTAVIIRTLSEVTSVTNRISFNFK